MVLVNPLTLPVAALAWLIRLENLGEPHLTLRPQPTWRPKDAQDQFDTNLRQEFIRLGLLDTWGRMDVELVSSLTVLCRPGAEFYGWINEGDRTRGVLAAAIGREAVLAIRDGDQVTVNQVRPESLPEVLVAQLPDRPPARGEVHEVTRSAVLAAAGHHQHQPPAVRAVHHLMTQPTTGAGELHVAARDREGRRRGAPHPLRYADTGAGRWLNHTTDAGNGEQRIVVAPTTRADLLRLLQDMHRSLFG